MSRSSPTIHEVWLPCDDGVSRREQLLKTLNQIKDLDKKFQVRLYRAGAGVERIDSAQQLNAQAPSTRLGDALKQVTGEAGSLPIGAVVLLSDGADNSGGIDLPTLSEIRRYRIPIHTVGFGREKPDHDIEIVDAQVPTRVLADSRLGAQVILKSFGYGTRHVRLNIQDNGKTLASKDVTLKSDGKEQTESVIFSAGAAGIRTLQIGIEPQEGEENRNNNAVTRLVSAESTRPRILYIEGEPKWEFKFIRRAIELDQSLQLTTILRTTQNKIYRQGIDSPAELEQGFPVTVDELFKYQGIVIGGVEANYFSPTQQELLKQFVDRRGGGILWLGGRSGLADGGWERSGLGDLLPVNLPDRKDTFHRDPANVELTSAGRDSLLCRLEDDPARNVDRWKKLPYLQNYQEAGTAKPGAVVLAELLPTSRGRHPLLVTQNYGRGRTAVFATAGSWRWQMSQPLDDKSHEMFWQQMLRWLVAGTYGPVVSSVPQTVFADEQRIPIRVEARDKNYLPLTDGRVEATVMGPGNTNEKIELRPDPATPGIYTAEYAAVQPGSYVVETAVRAGRSGDRPAICLPSVVRMEWPKTSERSKTGNSSKNSHPKPAVNTIGPRKHPESRRKSPTPKPGFRSVKRVTCGICRSSSSARSYYELRNGCFAGDGALYEICHTGPFSGRVGRSHNPLHHHRRAWRRA